MFDSLFRWFWTFLYKIDSLIAYLMGILYNCFEMASGIDTVKYNDSDTTLLQVVFGHSVINRAYWGMAIIGVGLCFFFTILAVIRKMFDSSNQVKSSLGEILTQSLKSIILICSMSLLMNMALYFSTSLMSAVQLAFFSNGSQATEEHPKTFTDSEYATMARVFNTIGNYSLNPSYNSRYNINSCYNDIRNDLQELSDAGTFDVQYQVPDFLTNSSHYWQASLQKIVNAAPDLSSDVPLDVYNESLTNAIEAAMDEIRTDDQFKPLNKYVEILGSGDESSGKVPLDRVILLVGTFDAAQNNKFNGENASLTDPLRAPFYYDYDDHDVYDSDDMWEAFDLSDFSFIMVLFLSFVLAKNMAVIILNCIARIFNMAMLYIIAPPFIALSPLDNGSKFKQWGVAFVTQCFGVFGTIIAMDLAVLFVPIIMSSDLRIFNSSFISYFAKLIIVWGAFETARKASSIVTAILSDNGAAAAGAGDMAKQGAALSSSFGGAVATMTGARAAGWVAGKSMANLQKRIQEKLPFGAGRGQKENSQNFVKAPGGGNDSGGAGGKAEGKQEGQNAAGEQKAAAGGKDTGAAGTQGAGAQKAVSGGKDTGAAAGDGNNSNNDGAGTDPQKAGQGEADQGAAAGGEGSEPDSNGGDNPQKVEPGEADQGVAAGGGGSEPDNNGGDNPQKVGSGEADQGSISGNGSSENSGNSGNTQNSVAGNSDSHTGAAHSVSGGSGGKIQNAGNSGNGSGTGAAQSGVETRRRSNTVAGRSVEGASKSTAHVAKTPPPMRKEQPPK